MNPVATTLCLLLGATLFAVGIGMAIWKLPWDEGDEDE